MRDDDKTDLTGWLGLRKLPDLTKARWLGQLLSFGGAVIVGGLFLLALATAFKLLFSATFGALLEDPRSALGVGGVTVALIGAPFVIWRSVVAQKTVNVTEQGHITDRINMAVQGLGTEKEKNWLGQSVTISAPDGNGGEAYSRTLIRSVGETIPLHDKEEPGLEGAWQVFTETQPNLEVRIGAIYALERIAQDSYRDHVQIMEILCAYIRQNAPAPETDDWPELEIKKGEEDGPLEADWEERLETFRQAQEEAKAKLKPREDIQTALTVIGRRSARQRRLEAGHGLEKPFPFETPCPECDGPEDDYDRAALVAYRKKLDAWTETLHDYAGYRLDLRNTDLRGADLAGADLKGGRLSGAHLDGADLDGARLQGARLDGARLQGTDLDGARLQGARLYGARLQGADLDGARLQGADLFGARLQGARLVGARLQRADLRGTQLQGADLLGARLQGADLDGALLQGARLYGARLQGADLDGARLDEDTDLAAATLRGAAVKAVDLTEVPQIAAHVPEMFGDASVTLPGGHGPDHENWPAHWPKFGMSFSDFMDEWRKWQADPENYPVPKPPGSDNTA